MARCVIVLAGEYGPVPPGLAPVPGDFVIACDAGLGHARRMGAEPDLLLGDFDSLEGPLPAGMPVARFPVRKDDTDAMLAAREGLGRGFSEFVLLFGLGGRLDHTLANLQTLSFLRRQGAWAELWGAGSWACLLKGGEERRFEPWPGYSFSVFAWDGDACGVTLRGFSYEAQRVDLGGGFPLGVSNSLPPGGEGLVRLERGWLLVVRSRL